MKRTIMIVDDEADFVEILTAALTQMGHGVISADDGFAALKILERDHETIDLILADIVMPEMSGFELIAAMREFAIDVPVILVSGADVDPQEARRRGAKAVFSKPFRLERLREIVDAALPTEHSE